MDWPVYPLLKWTQRSSGFLQHSQGWHHKYQTSERHQQASYPPCNHWKHNTNQWIMTFNNYKRSFVLNWTCNLVQTTAVWRHDGNYVLWCDCDRRFEEQMMQQEHPRSKTKSKVLPLANWFSASASSESTGISAPTWLHSTCQKHPDHKRYVYQVWVGQTCPEVMTMSPLAASRLSAMMVPLE